MSRLLHFKEQEQLRAFAKKREDQVIRKIGMELTKRKNLQMRFIFQGLTTLLPVRLQCSDGELSLYPGDSM